MRPRAAIAVLTILTMLAVAVPSGLYAGFAAEKLPNDVVEALRSGQVFMFYSLDANSYFEGSGFHGYKIMGYTSPDKETKGRIVDKLIEDTDKGGGAFCFMPHHGVRVFYKKRLYDLVICYQCGNMHIHTTGLALRHVGIGGEPDVLDQILKDAKIPLASREHKLKDAPKQ